MLDRAAGGKISFQAGEADLLVNAVSRALRVEVLADDQDLGYVLLFDAGSYDGPHAAKYVTAKLEKVEQLAKRHTPQRVLRSPTKARVVRGEEPVLGAVCPRLLTSRRGTAWPDLDMPPGWEGP